MRTNPIYLIIGFIGFATTFILFFICVAHQQYLLGTFSLFICLACVIALRELLE